MTGYIHNFMKLENRYQEW